MKKLLVIVAMVALFSMSATALAESGEFSESSDFDLSSTDVLYNSEHKVLYDSNLLDVPETAGTYYEVTLAGGYIYDDVTGDGIQGAEVEVLCVENGKTMTDTTDVNGYYLVTIQCGTGDTIEVTATAGDKSGSDSGTVAYSGSIYMGETRIDLGISRVDVTIPEFPVAALPALLSMFSFGLIRKRLF
ncbi:MAG: hypothetical protein GQ477_00680 [Nanohaloarchaea archaeon]|nr:hypothetical protein [Candidatus Nanohaloarchaea archaeon]